MTGLLTPSNYIARFFKKISTTFWVPVAISFVMCGRVQAKPLVDCINPSIGASTSREFGEGKTFPGAATPYGLVQLSPDTITGGDNGSGYSWEHTSIEGFSFTHMSGVGWHGDLGNLLVTPTTGPLKTGKGKQGGGDGYRSRFRHETEIVQAGYYSVMLDDYQVRAEMTAAPRAGILRFTFPKTEQSRIQIDLARRVAGTSVSQYVHVVDDHTIEGWMKCTKDGGGWGNGGGKPNYTVYFSAQFSKPIVKSGVWSAEIPDDWSRRLDDINTDRYMNAAANAMVTENCREMEGRHLGFFTEFSTKEQEVVLMKAGISFVSVEGARENLQHDIPKWDFDTIRQQTRSLWSKALGGVSIEGGTDIQREAFATSLYHAMIDPRSFSDLNGNYTGADMKVHHAKDFTYRTIFSGWDVFRSEYPLMTLIRPDVVNDTVNSLLQQAELSGRGSLARWEFLAVESGCMIGDPAVSVIADAYLKGIRGFDAEEAYKLCRQSVTGSHSHRLDLKDYETLGYVPESISWTLEDAYFDYCVGKFAKALGKHGDAAIFQKRSLNYRNIYDPGVGNMHARRKDGTWTKWSGATAEGQGCVESNPYQQGWFVPQDVAGMISMMGKDYFLKYLEEFFEKTPTSFKWNDYCNHANEPVHHVAYLFAYAGSPWLGQKWTRFIMENAYGAGVKGLCGNEDVGQMSAWYVLSAIGIHPVSPVDGVYVIGSPLFEKVTLSLDPKYYPGKTFTVVAYQNSKDNVYIQSARLNGKPLERSWLWHKEIVAGGRLELEMGPQPNKSWGAAPDQLPPDLNEAAAADLASAPAPSK